MDRGSGPRGSHEVRHARPVVEYARASDGVAIAYSVAGQGPTTVILPSIPFSNFVAEWEVPPVNAAYGVLARRMRIVQFDGRGTGHSQRDVDDVSPEAMLRDLDAVVRRLALRSANLLALYNACPIALAYAARRPDLVRRLALFGGFARGWTAMSAPRIQALLSLIDRDWDLFSRTAVSEWLEWQTDPSAERAVEAIRGSTTPAIARAVFQAISGFDVTAQVSNIVAPTLVLHRRDAAALSLESSAGLARTLPAGHLAVLPGASLTLWDRDGTQAAELISSFFVDGIVPESPVPAPGANGLEPLTPRERAVLRLVAEGLTNAEVAHRLEIAVSTVEQHLGNAYRKLGVKSRAEAAAFAVRHGLA